MFSKRLIHLRGNKTQDEVAEAIGINRPRYAHYEQGRNEPTLELLQKMANYFDVTIDYLIGRTDDPKGNAEMEEDIRMISRAAQKMSSKKREKMLELLKISFEEEFEDD